MLKQILKLLGKSVKSTTESMGKSMDFIDEVLEKEYIVNAVENVKEATGDAVEKAGTVYQKAKDGISDNINMEEVKSNLDEMVEKGKEMGGQLKEKMMDQSETMRNVMDEGEKMVDKIFGVEESEEEEE